MCEELISIPKASTMAQRSELVIATPSPMPDILNGEA